MWKGFLRLKIQTQPQMNHNKKLVEKDMLDLNTTLKDLEESTNVKLKKMFNESATTESFDKVKKQLLKHK